MNQNPLALLGNPSRQNTFAEKAEGLARDAAPQDTAARKRAAEEFASFLYLEVLKAMRATLPKDGLFEADSLSRDVYSSMFDSEIARLLAKRDGAGFTRTVERAIDKLTPPAPAPAPRPVGIPVNGTVSSTFGMRQDPIHGKQGFHGGVDIAAPAGAEIKAAGAGKVTLSAVRAGYGNIVEIDHGSGLSTRYAHNAANLVVAGEHIKAGQAIAIVGSSGRSRGSHLHFEVRQDGKPVDPAAVIGTVKKGSKLSTIV